MSKDIFKLLFSTSSVSTKIILEGTGSGTIPASGAGSSNSTTINIPHGHSDDDIFVEVAIYEGLSGNSYLLPAASSNLSVVYNASHDSTNLTIKGYQGAVVARPALNFDYAYRVFLP